MTVRVQTLTAMLVMLASIAGISLLQAPLAIRVHGVKQRDDVFALPSAKYIVPMSLGYRAAAADLLWTKLLLEYTSHWADRKYFRDAPLFIEDIQALDPTQPTLYRYLDTILIYQPTETNVSRGDEEDCRNVRRYFEVGLKALPYDADLWLHYGQFIAFMSPAYLSDQKEIEQWRIDGAKALAHAMDLGATVERTTAAASLLGRYGETKAAISYLERALSVAEDPDVRADLELQLRRYHAESVMEDHRRVVKSVELTWKSSFGYLSRELVLLITPAPNPAACAGPDRALTLECLMSWDAVEREMSR